MTSRIYRITNRIISEKSEAKFVLGFIIGYCIWFISQNPRIITSLSFLTAFLILLPILACDGVKILIESVMRKRQLNATEDLSKVTVVIPSYNGGSTLGATIESLLKRFPKNRIIVSSNGSTDNTQEVARKYGVKLLDFKEPLGKVGAINYALYYVKTPYCLILDDDVLINDAIIPTSLIDEGYEAVAFRVLPIKHKLLSMVQLHEYRKSMDIGRMFHNKKATVQSVSGAIGLFQTKELVRQTYLHTGEFSGEDLQRTLLVHLAPNKKGVVIVNSTVETDVPATLKELFYQRIIGWNPGLLNNLKIYLQILFKKNIPFALRYEAFYSIFIVVALDPLRIAALPILLLSPFTFLFFYTVYVMLETIPWLMLGRKDPYWVVLLYPIYGLFNLITRSIALAIFMYRRLNYYVGKLEHLDGYKFAKIKVKSVAASTSVAAFSGIVMFSSLVAKSYITPQQTQPIAVERSTIQSDIPYNFDDAPFIAQDPKPYSYTANAGDSAWKLAGFAIADYMHDHPDTTFVTRQTWIYNLITLTRHTQVTPGQTYAFTPENIELAYQITSSN